MPSVFMTRLRDQEGVTTGEPFTSVLWGASHRDMGAPGRSLGQSPVGGPLYGFSINSDSGRKGTTPHTYTGHRSNGTPDTSWTLHHAPMVALQSGVQ